MVAPEIFNLPASYFQASRDDTNRPELTALFKFSSAGSFSKLAPILYPPELRSRSKPVDNKLFMSSEIAKVYPANLFVITF